MAASGTYGSGKEYAQLIDIGQLGAICVKTLTLKPILGNRPPRLWETPSGMLNSIGLHNIGVETFLREKLPKLRAYRTRIIVNVYGETPDDFVAVARELDGAEGISALEVNVSCPNVAKGGLDLGTDPASHPGFHRNLTPHIVLRGQFSHFAQHRFGAARINKIWPYLL